MRLGGKRSGLRPGLYNCPPSSPCGLPRDGRNRYNPRTMNPFSPLIRRAEREWKRTKNRLGAFPDAATRLLTDFDYRLSQNQLDQSLPRWVSKSVRLPEQVALHNPFGQPPITLFNN